jgi:hypothetical protein
MRRLFVLLVLLLHASAYPMLLKSVRQSGSKMRSAGPQKERSYFTAAGVQRVGKSIAGHPELEKFNIVQGFALAPNKSIVLSNAYDISSKNPSDEVKLIKKMFHRVTPGADLLPTKSIFQVATFITPEIMGTLMGALETGELKRGSGQFTQDIVNAWYSDERVQAKLAEADALEYSKKFKEEVGNFFNLTAQLSQKNTNALNSILLAFLYQKINHADEDEEFHDWMHFLASINEYIPVFSKEEFEKLHRKLLEQNEYKSWFDSKLFSLKLNLIPYSSAQYEKFLVKNLPLVVSDIIENSKTESIYPLKVIMNEYGYEGQREKGDCVETAIRNVLYNLFYDPKKRAFDVSKYPDLPINPELKTYIETSNIENINTVPMGQSFMDLVSGQDPKTNIKYVEKNYELLSSSQNILHVFNALLGTTAQDWRTLGEQLTEMSGGKMEVDTELKHMGIRDKVTITIIDTLAQTTRYIDLVIMRLHAYVTFPEREKFKYKRIDLKSLATLPNINPALRSIFYLTGDIDIDLTESQVPGINPLLYFSWPVRNDDEKLDVIQKLLLNYSSDQDAVQYAYSLFKSLNIEEIRLLRNINLFKEYCKDKDVEFKNRTKDAVIAQVGLWHLKELLQEMTIEKVQQLMSSFMSIKEFDKALLSNSEMFEALLSDKESDKLLLYVLKKRLLREDESGYYQELVTEKLMTDLRNRSFIKEFYGLHPRWLSSLLDTLSVDVLNILSADADDTYYKESICSLLLKQNIDGADEKLYTLFYTSIFPLYISLLEKNYFEYIQELGDIRLRLKKGSDIYQMYDARMNVLRQKSLIAKE